MSTLKGKKKEVNPYPVFGVPFDPEAEKPPKFVTDIIDYLEENALHLEGLFRIPGDTDIMEKAKKVIESSLEYDFDELKGGPNTHNIAGLFKLYFRELPEPLLGYDYYDMFVAAQMIPEEEARLICVKKILAFLSKGNFVLLKALFSFLKKVCDKSDINKMTPSNVAVCFAPNILKTPNKTTDLNEMMQHSALTNKLTESLIQHYTTFFVNSEAKPKPPPRRSVKTDEIPNTSESSNISKRSSITKEEILAVQSKDSMMNLLEKNKNENVENQNEISKYSIDVENKKLDEFEKYLLKRKEELDEFEKELNEREKQLKKKEESLKKKEEKLKKEIESKSTSKLQPKNYASKSSSHSPPPIIKVPEVRGASKSFDKTETSNNEKEFEKPRSLSIQERMKLYKQNSAEKKEIDVDSRKSVMMLKTNSIVKESSKTWKKNESKTLK